jgi:uncharacterized membrane protein YcaP (DUF421 family)
MHGLESVLDAALGLQGAPNLWQMILRSMVVYIMSIALIRVGNDKRMMGRHSSFDMILAVIFGSVMSRAVNGSAPFFQTFAAGGVFIVAHWLLAAVTLRNRRAETWLKGVPKLLVRDGEILDEAMKRGLISRADLMESLRSNGGIRSTGELSAAWLEGNGEISVIRKTDVPMPPGGTPTSPEKAGQ